MNINHQKAFCLDGVDGIVRVSTQRDANAFKFVNLLLHSESATARRHRDNNVW